jgi:hypothetical protein
MTEPTLSGVAAPHGTCVHCRDDVYLVDDRSPAREHEPAGSWATLATGTSCPFRDEAGHAVYAEDKPTEPISGADLSGDAQIGQSWSRRFARPLDGDRSAIITVYFYVHNRHRAAVPCQPSKDAGPDQFVLVRATEFALCRQTDDGLVENFSRYTFVPVPDRDAT